METNLVIMKMTQGLSETILEGLEHIQKLLGEGKFEQTIFLFEDILEAFSTIEKSLIPIKQELAIQTIDVQEEPVKKALEIVVNAYEEKNYGKVQEIIQFTLRPKFKRFKEELMQAFKPYLLS